MELRQISPAPPAGSARGEARRACGEHPYAFMRGSTPRPPAPRVRGQAVRCTDGGVPTPAGVGGRPPVPPAGVGPRAWARYWQQGKALQPFAGLCPADPA